MPSSDDRTFPKTALPRGMVDVWVYRVRSADPPGLGATEAIVKAAQRFRRPGDRRRARQGAMVLRDVLARYIDISPSKIEITRHCGLCAHPNHGKPRIDRPESARWLRFNVSHSGDVLLIAVAREAEVGIDVERLDPMLDVVPVARTAFGDDFAERLRSLGPDRSTTFFQRWTQAEARLKCQGVGIVGLDRAPTDRSAEGLRDLHVERIAAPAGYEAALATSCPMPQVRYRTWEPAGSF